jgi:hypothetical protein
MKANPTGATNALLTLFTISAFLTFPIYGNAATVTGALQDISIQALNTKLTFSPTTNVLLTATGLNAGPPRTIETTNGQFSIVLEAGDYTVRLPLVPWRRPFLISVFNTNGAINITNLLAPPYTYTYTNDLSYAVKVTSADTSPDVLNSKLTVAGSLTKLLQTNGQAVTLVLSNGSSVAATPLHVNAGPVIGWSTNGEASLLDGAVTIPAGSLIARTVIRLEAFGSFSDPAINLPTATLRVKLGSTAIVTQAKGVASANWHLNVMLTVRSAGNAGIVAAAMAVLQDISGAESFSFATQTATIDTATNLAFDLTASIDNATDAENVTCEQAIITLQ